MARISLNTYGSWTLGYSWEPPTVLDERFVQTAKGYSHWVIGEHAEWINDHVGWAGELTPAAIKAVNPDIKAYRYYSLMSRSVNDSDHQGKANPVSAPEGRLCVPLSWSEVNGYNFWLRDGNGERVHEGGASGLNFAYLDVGMAGFRERYLANCLTRLRGKGFDGVVFDYWWPSIQSASFGSGWFMDHPMPAEYPTDCDWFRAWWRFVRYVVEGLQAHGYVVIGNCAGEAFTINQQHQWQRSILNGTVYEQFSLDWDGSWLSGETMKRRLESVAKDPLICWVQDAGMGAWAEGTPERAQRVMLSYCLYLLAVPKGSDRHAYHCSAGDRMKQYNWEPLWETDIGEPLGDRIPWVTGFAWIRHFERATVLVNYNDRPQRFRYKRPDKHRVYDVTLLPYTALISAA